MDNSLFCLPFSKKLLKHLPFLFSKKEALLNSKIMYRQQTSTKLNTQEVE